MANSAEHQFVWFEFDSEILALWQSIAAPTIRTFAYQQKLQALIKEHQSWQPNLDSLKVIDVFLSAIKSHLVDKRIQEAQALEHDEFVKMLVVVVFHTIQVLKNELSNFLAGGQIELYAAQGFSRLYARAFSELSNTRTPLEQLQRDAFYQDFVVFGVKNHQGVCVSQSFFVLAVIGTRLFGSMQRTITGLDIHGQPQKTASEDSLYWAVCDFLKSLQTIKNDHAKLLIKPKTIPKPPPNPTPCHDIFEQLEQTYLTDTSVAVADVADIPIKATANTKTNNTHIMPSQYKQKARASHTPKLFAEAYHDLTAMPLPQDNEPSYQKSFVVLSKFDKHISDELAKGKQPEQIVFGQQQKSIQQQALQSLAALVNSRQHTAAMLYLALAYFEGRGLVADTPKAVMLAKRAAELGDPRAQKLLSRLYYQGFDVQNGGIAADQTLGEMWLKKAADNGHTEAKKVCAYLNQVQILKEDYQAQTKLNQRYGVMLGIVAIVIGFVLFVINRLF